MSAFTEADQNTTMRRRIPLRESFVEAFPEVTPVLTMITKRTGMKTTSPTSSEVEWPFKTFRAPRNRAVYDGEDVDFTTESENNEGNKDMLKGRIQLIRSAVQTGRIAEAVINQHGGVEAGGNRSIHKDHIKDALRGMREDKEFIITSDSDSKAQAIVGGVKVPYQTRGFASWCRRGSPSHADLAIPAMAQIPAASIKSIASPSDFQESDLTGLLQSCWDARQSNGDWKMFNVPDIQSRMNEFLCFGELSETKMPIRRYNQDVSKDTIKLHVRIFESSFGKVTSIPKKNLPGTVTRNVTTVNGDATLTGLSTTADLYPGMPISGTGIPASTRILYIVSATSVELTANATASATVSATIGDTIYAELMDFQFQEYNYVDEVGWTELENKGGGPRGYADSLSFYVNLNPQAHALIKKS